MKKIGLLGGMSWESSLVYYRLINTAVRKRLGGHHSAPIVLESVDFAPIEEAMRKGDWDFIASHLSKALQSLEKAEAEVLLICTNTMHLLYPQLRKSTRLPLLHIASVTGEAIVKKGIKKVLLLGTAFTMEQPFFKEVLKKEFGITTLIPYTEDCATVHRIIFEELIRGEITPAAKTAYQGIIAKAQKEGAEGVIFGCTEIPLLLTQADCPLPVFDTTQLHAEAAVKLALN